MSYSFLRLPVDASPNTCPSTPVVTPLTDPPPVPPFDDEELDEDVLDDDPPPCARQLYEMFFATYGSAVSPQAEPSGMKVHPLAINDDFSFSEYPARLSQFV